METSAKSGFNILNLINTIAISIYEKFEKNYESDNLNISLSKEK